MQIRKNLLRAKRRWRNLDHSLLATAACNTPRSANWEFNNLVIKCCPDPVKAPE